jgi:hypothetical protein
MAGEKAIYAPGELDKVKQRLGPVDEKEAKRMQKLLGGEIGKERSEAENNHSRGKTAKSGARTRAGKDSTDGGTGKARRTVETAQDENEERKSVKFDENKPFAAAKAPYLERIKMDSCCGEAEFGIKTVWQVFFSKICFFKPPPDMVSMHFVRQNLNEYYRQIETLVTNVRLLFPKNNTEMSSKLKKISPAAFTILDIFRQWKINQISIEIGKMQSHPRNVYVTDFQSMLRHIYRPLFILEDLIIETDIEDAFSMLYKVMFLESPTAETENEKKKISAAIAAYRYIKESIRYLLYPILMKNLCSTYFPYDVFFSANNDKIMLFLGVNEKDKIKPFVNKKDLVRDLLEEENKTDSDNDLKEPTESTDEIHDLIDESAEEEARKAEEKKAAAAELKVVDKGIKVLEMLFPKAGFKNLESFPDLYPYFAGILMFKKGCELISPKDPAQIALILSAVTEEMLLGFRSIKFLNTTADTITPILDDWNYVFDETFYDTYLQRIDEYVGVIKSGDSKSSYAMNIANEIQWTKRYYIFPYYDYKSGLPPSFSRKDIRSIFSLVRRLRKVLTDIAADIDTANKSGGMLTGAACQTMANPWDAISFEVENPISKRINRLLTKGQKTNVNLIFFTLAVVTVLDNFLNNPSSIAYTANQRMVFRSVNNEGREPILWVDKRTDVDEIFKESLTAKKD